MKTINFIGLVFLMLIFGCSIDEKQFQDFSDDNFALKKAVPSGEVFIVRPSGEDDTYELVTAFENAKAAGPGSVVQLVGGEYHIGLIEVRDFYGVFRGAGKGKSVIYPMSDLQCNIPLGLNLSISLMKFLNGDVTVSDMSFINGEGQACAACEDGAYCDVLWSFLAFYDYTIAGPMPPDHYVKGKVDRVEFVGYLRGPYEWQVLYGIGFYADFAWAENLPFSNGELTVTNCDFSNFYNAVQTLGFGSGSFIFSNNTVNNTLEALLLLDNIGGRTTIAGNIFIVPPGGKAVGINTLVYGLQIQALSSGCQYEITGNTFYLDGSFAALDLCDTRKLIDVPDDENPLLVLVKNNQFILENGPTCGIWNFATDDAVIRNNKFTGQSGWTGIVSIFADNTLMLGNNFSTLTVPEYHIFLESVSSNCTVIGGNHQGGLVLDLGVNNTITGLKQPGGVSHTGQTIIDNYRIMHEKMGKMRP